MTQELSDREQKQWSEDIMLYASPMNDQVYKLILGDEEESEEEKIVKLRAAMCGHLLEIYCANPMNWESWKRFMSGRIHDCLWTVYALMAHGDGSLAKDILAVLIDANRRAEPDFYHAIYQRYEHIDETRKAAKDLINE